MGPDAAAPCEVPPRVRRGYAGRRLAPLHRHRRSQLPLAPRAPRRASVHGSRRGRPKTCATVDLNLGVARTRLSRMASAHLPSKGSCVVLRILRLAFCSHMVLSSACRSGSGPADANEASDARLSGACPSGPVTFQLEGASGTGWFFSEARPACSGHPVNWLTILDSSGKELVLIPPCSSDCSLCSNSLPCSQICCTIALAAQSESLTWDGRHFVSGTCGSPSKDCFSSQCASPAQYTARFCAFEKARADSPVPDCSNPTGLTCLDVPFTYPSLTPVSAMLP